MGPVRQKGPLADKKSKKLHTEQYQAHRTTHILRTIIFAISVSGPV
jgi:hypothetical protein